MDIEKLLPLILLIGWSILSTVANRKNKKRKAEQLGQSGEESSANKQEVEIHPSMGIFERLKQFADEAGLAREEPIIQLPKAKTVTNKMGRIEAEEAKKPKKAENGPEVLSDELGSSPMDNPIQDIATLPFSYSQALKKPPRYSGDELRKAVIWSEILAPPVSMRD